MDVRGGLLLHHAQPSDYARVLALVDDWWEGRQMSARVSRVFFSHCAPTSFVMETDAELVGFLLGSLSQTRADEACIHFVGVHPEFRRLGLGRRLYERFFAAARMHERAWVSCIAAACNEKLLAFNGGVGFVLEHDYSAIEGVPARLDFADADARWFVFHRHVTPELWPTSSGPCLGVPSRRPLLPAADFVAPARPPSAAATLSAPALAIDLTDCAR